MLQVEHLYVCNHIYKYVETVVCVVAIEPSILIDSLAPAELSYEGGQHLYLHCWGWIAWNRDWVYYFADNIFKWRLGVVHWD